AFGQSEVRLDDGGEYRQRHGGERHAWDADAVSRLQRAVRDESHATFEQFAEAVDAAGRNLTLRGGLELRGGSPIPLDRVEPSAEIVQRFATGATRRGSISGEGHETQAA